jgi:uncharacterized membrane protein YphA (DoxX/SURF4 family)
MAVDLAARAFCAGCDLPGLRDQQGCGFFGGGGRNGCAGLPAPAAMALLGIFVELTGSLLVLINRWVWLGAGMLSVFTAIGAVTAHAFWKVSGPGRKEATAVFLMHVGLIAAFALDALLAERVAGQ